MDKWCNSPFYRFRGWGFEELCWCWQMDCGSDDDRALDIIEELIVRCMWRLTSSEKNLSFFQKKVIRDIRAFVMKLSMIDNGYSYIWSGLSVTKDDFIFLQIFNCLKGHAWS